VELAGDEMVFAAAPSLGLEGAGVSLDRLFAQTLFARSEGCCSRTMLQRNVERLGRQADEFRRVVVFDDLHVIVDSLVRGEGVAFISSDLIRPHVEAGRLRELRVPGFHHARMRTLIFGDRVPASGPAAVFLEKLRARLEPPGKLAACV
jgi:DNA-binding transcriptional LysR family regulator